MGNSRVGAEGERGAVAHRLRLRAEPGWGMTLDEAKIEATKRWRVVGGWADRDGWRCPGWRCSVGIRRDAPGGMTERVTLGHAKTFEKAFLAAERTLKRPSRPPRRGVFPNVEMPL